MSDLVNHPAHYTHFSIEVIDIIDRLNFCAGSAIKYILRAPFKGEFKRDLMKAIWYLRRIQDHHIETGIGVEEERALHQVSMEVAVENFRQALVFIAEGKIDWAIKEIEAAIEEEKGK